jgi:hypothetical protein
MRDSNVLEGSTLFELLNHDAGFDNTWKFAEFDEPDVSKTPDMRGKGKFHARNTTSTGMLGEPGSLSNT